MHLGALLVLKSYFALLPDAPRGPLWADVEDVRGDTLPLWKAALIAFLIELAVPLLVFGVDWSWLPDIEEPAPIPVMSVRLDEPPPEAVPQPPPPPEQKPQEPPPPRKIQRRKRALEAMPPKPVPNEPDSRIALPEPLPEPQPEPPKPEKKPEPVPEEPPPLPSVFRDVKPVKKVRAVYPPEAEQQHIQGRVKVRLDVNLEGDVTNAQILISEPPGVFDEAVLTAVRQYKFKKDGTEYQADQEVLFKIDE